MKILLRLKHWQLFSIVIGIPILVQIVFITMIFRELIISKSRPEDVFDLFSYAMLTSVVAGFIQFTWSYIAVVELRRYMRTEDRFSLRWFRVHLAFLALWMPIFLGIMHELIGNVLRGSSSDIIDSIYSIQSGIPFLMVPHAFTTISFLYILHTLAKSLKTAELQRAVVFKDYATEFFLLWFFPIGVWEIQPRVNELFAQSEFKRHNSSQTQ